MASKFIRKTKRGGFKGVQNRTDTDGSVSIGIIDAGAYVDGDLTVAAIGFIHEFGAGRIPERSFIRSTTFEKRQKIVALQKSLLSKIVNGSMDIETALGTVGDVVRGMIEEKIVAIRTPPNAPRTLAAKFPKTNPLIDTGQLKNSIKFEVNR